MYDIQFPPRSNRASWSFAGIITDFDDGSPVDLSLCKMVFSMRDRNGNRLEASTDNGKLTSPDTGMFAWFFTADEMGGFCPGQCDTGMVLWHEDDPSDVRQLSVGPVNIVDGVVP